MVSSEFNPDFTHPYYFIRKCIYRGIREYSKFINGKVLDFGCGSKPYVSLFNYSEYIGVDFENPGHSHENENIDILYDGINIPLLNGSIDSILCSEVFEHVFNLPHILNEFYRLLKPGGFILATCPFVWKEHELPNDYARYTLFALDNLLTSSGFEKIEVSKGGNFVEVLAQLSVLFFYDKYFGKANRFWVTNKLFVFSFIFLPNLIGFIFSKLFNKTNQMYLSNIIVYRKK